MSQTSAAFRLRKESKLHGMPFPAASGPERSTSIPATVKLRGNRNVGETTCLIDNKDLRLLPNINVGVTIVAAEHSNVLTLQRDALRMDDSKPYVFRIVDDHIKRQTVEFSLQNLTRVEITSGLSEGDTVALPAEESTPLVDGATVKVVP